MPPPPGYVITPSGQQPTRSANDTAEFRRNYGANEFVNALYALDHGYTAQGVTVGVIDDGAVQETELAGRIDLSKSKDFGYVTSGGVTTKRDSLGDAQSDHGTAVAGIIAGNRDGVGAMGYAPDARIAVLRIADNNLDTGTETISHVVEALDYAGSEGLKVVNVSLTTNGSPVYGNAVARFGVTGGLVVNSAGNSAGDNPEDAGAVTSANANAFLFVVALSPSLTSYTLASYSNKAGTQMDRTVAAVGSNVTTMVDGSTGVFSGTSSATPVVTALAATILSKWPQLSGQQAGDVILNTARDIGAPGIDAVFGHGLVDYQAALSPVDPTLSNGSMQTSVQTSVMAVPAVMGVTSLQTALSNVTVLDAYGRDFSGSVAGLVIRPESGQGHWLRRRLAQMGDGGYADLAAGPFSGGLGFASYRTGPNPGDVRSVPTTGSFGYQAGSTGFHAGFNAQDSLQSDIMGLAPFADGVLAYAPQAGNSFGVDQRVGGGKLAFTMSTGRAYDSSANAATLGWSKGGTDFRMSLIDESGSIMGTPTGEGALRLGRGATTAMVEAKTTVDLAGGWSLEGYGSVGFTKLKIDPASLVTGSSALIGTRIGVQASRRMLGGVMSLGIAQPLMIESGDAHLTLGSGYNLASRSLTYADTDASLTGQRRLQLTTGFSTGGARSSFRIGLAEDLADGSTKALAGWRVAFD